MLRKINKWCTKAYVMLPLVGIFIFVSCRKEAQAPTTQQYAQSQNTVNSVAKLRKNFNAEDYLKGIFFVSGPVADLIPELANLKMSNFISDQAMVEYVDNQENKIIETLSKQNPTFLSHFKTEITSGDQVRIQIVINEALNNLRPILDSYYKVSDKEMQKQIDASIAELKANKNYDAKDLNKTKAAIKDFLRGQNPTSTNGRCAVLGVVFVVAVVFIAVVALALAIDGTAPPIQNRLSSDGLYKDQLVNSIAINLH